MLSYLYKFFYKYYNYYMNIYKINYKELLYSKTDNNALALETTNNYLLDLFVNLTRDSNENDIFFYLDKCIKIDPVKTVAIILNSRDRKKGKKEKTISNKALLWLKYNNFLNTYNKNLLTYIDKYGCWKDLNYLVGETYKKNYNLNTKNVDNFYELNLYADQLIKDKENIENNISLCAKWFPSQQKRVDKRYNVCDNVAKILLDKNINKYSEEEYDNYNKKRKEFIRKNYLTPLRNKLNILEKYMCNNDWKNIDYEKVPSIASNKFRNAFIKHDNERYCQYLTNVSKGICKINTTGILPHELVNYYLENNNAEVDETIELQWKTILKELDDSKLFDNLLSVVDVSGSMFSASNGSIPGQVAISIGLLIANCCKGVFKNKVITFHSEPSFHEIKGDTLKEQVECISKADWGYNTNFEAIADLIIESNSIPDKLVILSDMQFDQAFDNNLNTELPYNTFKNKFIDNYLDVPKIIYWNLNSDNGKSFPIDSKIENTAIISGFSEQLFKIFTKYDDFTPELVLNGILEPYENDVFIDMKEYNDYIINS